MLKSPEEYLSALSFEPPEPSSRQLSSGEKIFIEKYLGLEAYEGLPEIHPENEADFTLMPPEPAFPLEMEPEITAPQKDTILPEKAPERLESVVSESGLWEPELLPQKQSIPPRPAALLKEEPPVEMRLETAPPAAASPDPVETVEIGESGEAATEESEPMPVQEAEIPREKLNIEPAAAIAPILPEPVGITAQTAEPAAENETAPEKAPVSLKDSLKNEAEIQMVSFFTADQLFLLPVLSIQEVLRHQELIKVPQAPEFVAGVINLRGHVMPVVHISALLTNAKEHPYGERNFIIVCGTDQLKIGLIIDRINSMHVMPQTDIIWNAEAKLGEAAEFLCAIATLDEKVTGVIEPETIAQKILSP